MCLKMMLSKIIKWLCECIMKKIFNILCCMFIIFVLFLIINAYIETYFNTSFFSFIS